MNESTLRPPDHLERKAIRRVLRVRTATVGQTIAYTFLTVILAFEFVPIVMMLVMSMKDTPQIYVNFWGLPDPWRLSNYVEGLRVMWRYIINTVIMATIGVGGAVLFATLTGYTFARHRFAAKEMIFTGILALLMIPGILTLIPAYVWVSQLGLLNTPAVLILPWMAGGQVLGIFITRTFFAALPEELFEAARIDGADELQLFVQVGLPLSWPIVLTLLILQMHGTYNDYIWPLLTVSDPKLQVVSVGLTQFVNQYGVADLGPQFAAYAVTAIPLIVLFTFGMKYFIQGITSGALKA